MSFDPPKSRNEAILQNMLGANNALDPPKSRVEELLLRILEQGGSGGGVTPEQIAAAVEAYLDEHGVTVNETDPTVPAWAKQPTKPTYTAQEVGALPSDTPIPQDKVFVAVRGTTTETQIREAHNAGKVVMCVYQNRVYYLADTEGKMTFRTETDALGAVYALFVSGSTWGGMSYNFALDSDIPVVPQMATQTDMSDWTQGKTVDAAVLKADFTSAIQRLAGVKTSVDDLQTAVGQKANSADIPTKTSDLTNDSGFQTAAQVQSAISAAAELPSGGSTGDFLRKTASGVAWQTVPSAESNSFGGGS